METSLQLVSRLNAAIQRQLDLALQKAFGITYAQARVVELLSAQPTHSHADLSSKLGSDSSGTGRLIVRLRKKGLVEQRIHDGDRRCLMVFLTERGLAMAPSIPVVIQGVETGLLDALVDEERIHLVALLKRLIAVG